MTPPAHDPRWLDVAAVLSTVTPPTDPTASRLSCPVLPARGSIYKTETPERKRSGLVVETLAKKNKNCMRIICNMYAGSSLLRQACGAHNEIAHGKTLSTVASSMFSRIYGSPRTSIRGVERHKCDEMREIFKTVEYPGNDFPVVHDPRFQILPGLSSFHTWDLVGQITIYVLLYPRRSSGP